MKRFASFLAVTAVFAVLSTGAFAQTAQEHQEHHPSETTPAVPPPSPAPAPPAVAPAPSNPGGPGPAGQAPMGQMPMDQTGQMPMGQMMQGMPEQCRTMMQSMPQSCMSMMQQMMMGRMGSGPGMQMPAAPAPQSSATKAYLDAAQSMHGPMMDGLRAPDADVAFMRGMVAHHQGAIDMAKVVLQYGKDDQTKKWANDIIREQQREIGEMQEWLKKNAR